MLGYWRLTVSCFFSIPSATGSFILAVDGVGQLTTLGQAVVTGRQSSSRGVQSGWVGSEHGLGGRMWKCREVLEDQRMVLTSHRSADEQMSCRG